MTLQELSGFTGGLYIVPVITLRRDLAEMLYILPSFSLSKSQVYRSSNAPSPEAPRVHAGQPLSRLVDPEDSLFYKSSLGEDSDGSSSDAGDSSKTVLAYKLQDKQLKESPRSVL